MFKILNFIAISLMLTVFLNDNINLEVFSAEENEAEIILIERNNEGKRLVPIGRSWGPDEVEEIVYTYLLPKGVSEEDVYIESWIAENGGENIFVFDLSFQYLNDQTILNLSVTLNEPETIEEREILLNGSFDFKVKIK